jgi:hypothetical protein
MITILSGAEALQGRANLGPTVYRALSTLEYRGGATGLLERPGCGALRMTCIGQLMGLPFANWAVCFPISYP